MSLTVFSDEMVLKFSISVVISVLVAGILARDMVTAGLLLVGFFVLVWYVGLKECPKSNGKPSLQNL